jgi:hypothetical protein
MTPSQLLTEYQIDQHRDDDMSRWRGDINSGDFKRWKHALQSGDVGQVKHVIDHHHESPELSCTYHNPDNITRWRHNTQLLSHHTTGQSVVVELGAGSHAQVAQMFLSTHAIRCYIICDLVSPLLLAYHNMSKHHRTHYVRSGDTLETLLDSYECILLPHHLCHKLYQLSAATYYSSYSLGEMCDDEVQQYMDIMGMTSSKLISENYMTGNGSCHLCDEPYTPLQSRVPHSSELLWKQSPVVRTNPGCEIQVLLV